MDLNLLLGYLGVGLMLALAGKVAVMVLQLLVMQLKVL